MWHANGNGKSYRFTDIEYLFHTGTENTRTHTQAHTEMTENGWKRDENLQNPGNRRNEAKPKWIYSYLIYQCCVM